MQLVRVCGRDGRPCPALRGVLRDGDCRDEPDRRGDVAPDAAGCGAALRRGVRGRGACTSSTPAAAKMTATAGIDTWSPCWYVDPDSMAAGIMNELATTPSGRGSLLPDAVLGHRVGWHRLSGMLYAEGHPGGDGALLVPDELPAALGDLEQALIAHGVPVPPGLAHEGSRIAQTDDLDGFGGIRRCDATVDYRTSSRSEGLAILAGAAAVAATVPRAQASVRYAKDGSGSVETVYLHGCAGKRVLGRWYDKGLESFGLGRRGQLIRIEDQRRYPKGLRRGVDELTTGYCRHKLQERFLPMWKATKGVKVASVNVLGEKIADLAYEGEITWSAADYLAGYVFLERYGRRLGPDASEKQRAALDRMNRDRRKRLREHGLVHAQGAMEEVEVDLHAVMEQVMDEAAWTPQG